MSDLHVVFKVADAEYVISAADVVQMESFTGATRVPGAAPYVAGLVQIRGQVVPVVDLRARFQLPPVEHGLDARVLVVQQGERTVGLLVDSAREVLHLQSGQMRPTPDLLKARGEAFVKGVAQAGNRLVMLIDTQSVVGEELVHGP